MKIYGGKRTVDKSSKKIASVIGAIKTIRDFVPSPTLHCIYIALIQSQFDYCNIFCGNCEKTLFDGLQKPQNRAARVLTFSRHDADANRLFRQLNWKDLSTQFQIQKALMVYKSLVQDIYTLNLLNDMKRATP